ncbi:MAG: redoxin domain-containing protein [Bacteroidota bacterium]
MSKIKFIPVLLTAFILSAFKSNASSDGYQVKIKITPVFKDSLYYLANYFGDKQYIQDSAKADAAGMVIFKGKEKLPGGIYLFVVPGKKYFELIIDKEQNFTMETDTAEMVKNMVVKGSEDNQKFYNYLRFVMDKQKEAETLQASMHNAKTPKDSLDALDKLKDLGKVVTDFKLKYITDYPDFLLSKVFKTSQEPEVPEAPLLPNGMKDSTFAYRYYKAHYLDNVDFTDARLLRTPLFHTKLDTYIKKLVMQVPDSINKEADMLVAKARPNPEVFKYVVWYLTNTYETSNIMGMDAVFVHMAKTYYTKEQATWVDSTTLYKIQERVKVLEPILIGKKVQNLIMEDTSGNYKALYNIKTPYTVLLFWDPDCGHCQKVVPEVKKLYDIVKGKGAEVYAICTETEMDKWRKFIREKHLDWINVADPKYQNNFRYEFDITSTPQIYLLDSNKDIIAKKIDVEILADILSKKLNMKIEGIKNPEKPAH